MPTRKYGCPYQGSKDFIAEAIVAALPSAETFVHRRFANQLTFSL